MEKKVSLTIIKDHFRILVNTVKAFIADKPVELASTTAYFAIFSIAPILILIISIFGYFAGNAAIRDKLFEELNVLIGQESTEVLQNAISNYQIAENSVMGTIIGVSVFLISATTLFGIMQRSINYMWRVKGKPSIKLSIFKFLRDRLLSFGVILTLGFILLVSLLVDAGIGYMKKFLIVYFGKDFLFLAQLTNLLLSLAIISAVFTVIYHYLPDVKVRWNASWFGGVFTAVLFVLGKIIIGFVIGKSELGAVYDAASAFIGILLWIYYASMIFYFGVGLTRQFSLYYKHENTPLNYAVPFKIITQE